MIVFGNQRFQTKPTTDSGFSTLNYILFFIQVLAFQYRIPIRFITRPRPQLPTSYVIPAYQDSLPYIL